MSSQPKKEDLVKPPSDTTGQLQEVKVSDLNVGDWYYILFRVGGQVDDTWWVVRVTSISRDTILANCMFRYIPGLNWFPCSNQVTIGQYRGVFRSKFYKPNPLPDVISQKAKVAAITSNLGPKLGYMDGPMRNIAEMAGIKPPPAQSGLGKRRKTRRHKGRRKTRKH